mmetsp:Transcript_58565/g.115155  ORF Transcript_58565/g.115155 Transcript_58565/m.115155 type:complete len:220 (+) Transcript_58565:432-1091(+)
MLLQVLQSAGSALHSAPGDVLAPTVLLHEVGHRGDGAEARLPRHVAVRPGQLLAQGPDHRLRRQHIARPPERFQLGYCGLDSQRARPPAEFRNNARRLRPELRAEHLRVLLFRGAGRTPPAAGPKRPARQDELLLELAAFANGAACITRARRRIAGPQRREEAQQTRQGSRGDASAVAVHVHAEANVVASDAPVFRRERGLAQLHARLVQRRHVATRCV